MTHRWATQVLFARQMTAHQRRTQRATRTAAAPAGTTSRGIYSISLPFVSHRQAAAVFQEQHFRRRRDAFAGGEQRP